MSIRALKPILILATKFIFALTLITWLIQSGKIDFALLKESFRDFTIWPVAFFILILNLFLSSWRWKLILEIKSKEKITYFQILRLTWIGCLFNTVLPGAVSGDLIKLVYARKIDKSLTKTFLLTSVFIDRILGLFSLLTLLGFSTLLKYNELLKLGPQIATLVHFNLLLFSSILIFVFSLFIPHKKQQLLLTTVERLPILGNYLREALVQFWLIGQNQKKILFLTFMGLFMQTLNIFAFWFITSPYAQYIHVPIAPLTLLQAFTFLPVGMISVAIPITPAGLGVGHAIFDILFRYYNVSNGASLFNIYFLLGVTVNLMGLFPYLFNKNQIHQNEIQDFQSEFTAEERKEHDILSVR